MSFRLLPECKVCHRQSQNLTRSHGVDAHKELCRPLLELTGSLEMARQALAEFQRRCPHPDYRGDYEYVPGMGRDHWWWCTVCFEVEFTSRPAWATA